MSLLAVACALVLPASAAAAPKPKPAPTAAPEATVKIQLDHLKGGRAEIYSKVRVLGTVAPYVPGQEVKVSVYLDGRKQFDRSLPVGKGKGKTGKFETAVSVRENGKYAVSAKHVATPELGADSTARKSWKVSFPSLHQGQ